MSIRNAMALAFSGAALALFGLFGGERAYDDPRSGNVWTFLLFGAVLLGMLVFVVQEIRNDQARGL
jgi:hypothetical protein